MKYLRFKPSACGITCLVALILCGDAFAIPASPDPVEVRQPDGSTITIRLRGDEYFSWHEDVERNVIMRDPASDWWVYARQVGERLESSGNRVGWSSPPATRPDIAVVRRATARRQAASAPEQQLGFDATRNTVQMNLVILVNFQDDVVQHTAPQYNDLFNEVGHSFDGAQGSVRDYYDEISYGEFLIVSHVIGPFTVEENHGYYGENDEDSHNVNIDEMVYEALILADESGFDFNIVDGNGDSVIDGLTFIHGGGGEEYAGNNPDYIWSHRGSIIPAEIDGVYIYNYHTEPARRGFDSDPASWGITRIGVICHENGHFIGLPDLYDRDGGSRGAGRFCLMAGGNWNGDQTRPCHMSAWCKLTVGFLMASVPVGEGTFSLDTYATDPDCFYLDGTFPNQEYFLVENRQGIGFDDALPGTERGILIWHVDPDVGHNDDPNHYMVDLEEASGRQHLQLDENSGDDWDYYRGSWINQFNITTDPNNVKYNGDALSVEIRHISHSAETMTLDIMIYNTWVDFNFGGPIRLGSYLFPFNTMLEGLSAVPAGGRIAFRTAGASPYPVTIDQDVKLMAPLGPVVIGASSAVAVR